MTIGIKKSQSTISPVTSHGRQKIHHLQTNKTSLSSRSLLLLFCVTSAMISSYWWCLCLRWWNKFDSCFHPLLVGWLMGFQHNMWITDVRFTSDLLPNHFNVTDEALLSQLTLSHILSICKLLPCCVCRPRWSDTEYYQYHSVTTSIDAEEWSQYIYL